MDDTTYRTVVALAAFIGPALAALIAAAAAILATRYEARRAEARARSAENERRSRERLDRVREWNVRQIEETRRNVVAQIDSMRVIVRGQATPWHFARVGRVLESNLLASAQLIGDVEAVQGFVAAMLRVFEKLSPHAAVRLIQLFILPPFDAEDGSMLDDARAKVLAALRQQQERVLRDEPLLALGPDTLRQSVDMARVDAAARRFMRSPGSRTPAARDSDRRGEHGP